MPAPPAVASTAACERERIHRLLLDALPGIEGYLFVGPSGSLVLTLPGGDGAEIGRLPHRGRTRWVVVARRDGRTRVIETGSGGAVVRAVGDVVRSGRKVRSA